MILKNYTSDVPASVTIGRIQQILIDAGVSGIEMSYGPKREIEALTFRIQIGANRPPMAIRMPAQIEAVQNALWLDYAGTDTLSRDGSELIYGYGRKKKKRKDFLKQGEMTAWKIMQDWLQVQLSLIHLQKADFAQVFLSYIWDGKQNFYDRLKGNGFQALMPPKESGAAQSLDVVS